MSEKRNIISKIIESSLKTSLVSNKKNIKLHKAKVVKRISGNSPAAVIGIKEGDFLLDVNGVRAIDRDLWEWSSQSDHHKYTYCLSDNKILQVDTNGIPLGVELAKTTEAVIKQYDNADGEPEDLADLWEREEDQTIIYLVDNWKRKGILWFEKYVPDFLSRIFLLHDIEVLFVAVALYEKGLYEEALNYLLRYVDEYLNRWTTQYHGIAFYYLAKNFQRTGDEENAREFFEKAYGYSRIDRIKKECLALGGEVEEEYLWKGKKFPLDYSLPLLDDRNKSLSLIDCLQQMENHQLFIVCSLGMYRSNGPYDEFMKRFLVLQQYFGDVFAGLHVITSGDENQHWTENEDEAKRRGLNFSILFDHDDNLTVKTLSTGSPDIFLLDNKKIIIEHQKLNTEVDVWDLYMSRLSMETGN